MSTMDFMVMMKLIGKKDLKSPGLPASSCSQIPMPIHKAMRLETPEIKDVPIKERKMKKNA